MKGFFVVSRHHSEWHYMWKALLRVGGSHTDRNPENGEAWFYAGSFWKPRWGLVTEPPTWLLVHRFCHPDRSTAAKPIPQKVNRGYGHVVLDIAASRECSRYWNEIPTPGMPVVTTFQ